MTRFRQNPLVLGVMETSWPSWRPKQCGSFQCRWTGSRSFKINFSQNRAVQLNRRCLLIGSSFFAEVVFVFRAQQLARVNRGCYFQSYRSMPMGGYRLSLTLSLSLIFLSHILSLTLIVSYWYALFPTFHTTFFLFAFSYFLHTPKLNITARHALFHYIYLCITHTHTHTLSHIWPHPHTHTFTRSPLFFRLSCARILKTSLRRRDQKLERGPKPSQHPEKNKCSRPPTTTSSLRAHIQITLLSVLRNFNDRCWCPSFSKGTITMYLHPLGSLYSYFDACYDNF